MAPIIKKDIYVCVGDKRHIYLLPKKIDDVFASEMKALGTLKRLDIDKDTVWFLDGEDRKLKCRFESGKKELDARFSRNEYKEKVNSLEDFLKTFFNSDIKEEN